MADEFKERVGRYQHYADRTGDIVRQLAFAGIAMIWIFRVGADEAPRFPALLLMSGLLLAVALAVDLLHYAINALSWGARVKHEGNVGDVDAIRRISGWEVWAVGAKVLVVTAAYVLICWHFVSVLQARAGDPEVARPARAAVINSVGLALDIGGAVLLFLFGLPPAISREGHSALLLEGTDEAMKRRARLYDRLGRLGITLIVLGFLCQLVAGLLK